MVFAPLTYRESLPDIEACLRSMGSKLYHVGFLGKIARGTGVRSDQTVALSSAPSAKAYPDALCRIHYRDPVTEKRLKFLTFLARVAPYRRHKR